MGASTGDMLVDNQDTLEAIFKKRLLILLRIVKTLQPLLKMRRQLFAEYGEDIDAKFHPRIRDAASCLKSSQLAYDLATKHGSNLHILHLTTADEMKLFTEGEIQVKKSLLKFVFITYFLVKLIMKRVEILLNVIPA